MAAPLLTTMLTIPLPVSAASIIAFYFITISICRLFFHPLRSVPGPKLAALTPWYEFYYDCLKSRGGQFSAHIRQLHAKYGPIVRVGPNHVHVNDPAYFDILYNNSLRLNRDKFYYRMFGRNQTVVSTIDAEAHRVRRSALNKYFSKANVKKLSSRIESVVQKLCTRLTEYQATNATINLSNAARAFTTDVVVSYLIGDRDGLLGTADLGASAHRRLRIFAFLTTWQRQFPFFLPSMNWLRWLISLSESAKAPSQKEKPVVFSPQRDLVPIAELYAQQGKNDSAATRESNIFRTIYAADNLSDEDKEPERAAREVRNLVGAGQETTGSVLSYLCYAILRNPDVLRRLKSELLDAVPSAAASGATDQLVVHAEHVDELSYLNAVIKEGLRMRPLTGRLARYHPAAILTYTAPNGRVYTFPPGTVISMSTPDVLHNPEIFEDPMTFKPERWLGKDKGELDKRMVAFGRGPQMCIGLELAKREMQLFLGNVFGSFDFELVDTMEGDVGIQHDFFMGIAGKDARGVRARVLGNEQA